LKSLQKEEKYIFRRWKTIMHNWKFNLSSTEF